MIKKVKPFIQFPVIGIGASAGGLEAIKKFFASVQNDCGMAFIIIVHLMKHRKSEISNLIARITSLDVFEISNGMTIKPNTIFITPPDHNINLKKNQLFLSEIIPETSVSQNIDYFFTSLSNELKDKSVCIILSGTLKDGTEGLRAIKDNGGMVMVQDTETAQFNGMPASAISTGLVDFILPVQDLYQKLQEYIQHSYYQRDSGSMIIDNENAMNKIFLLLHSYTGHDFSNYKQNTMQRRIAKRMAIFHYENVMDYYQNLENNEEEIWHLFNNLLIGVTSFFRDPDVFEKLKSFIESKILEKKPPAGSIRIWIPGCSTGEEAYTITIILNDIIEQQKKNYDIRFFATDISKNSIEIARQGVFQSNLLKNVSEEIKKKYFEQDRDVYKIKKNIRNMITFSNHDIIKDPPFSKLDLICCRNLLIYFDVTIQNKVITLFHYALNPGGILLLGTSETIGKFATHFTALDKKSKLFQKNNIEIKNKEISFLYNDQLKLNPESEVHINKKLNTEININEFIKNSILINYSPVCVILNSTLDVLYIHGKSGKYFEPPTGEARWNVLDISREGLKEVLSMGLFKVKEKNEKVNYYSVKIKNDDSYSVVDIEIKPINKKDFMTGMIMIIIKDITKSFNEQLNDVKNSKKNLEVKELQKILSLTQEQLQTTIEEYETSNEELKSANEELQSTNEELQSTNEELETSKEELQSTNEELQSLISEHQSKIDELIKLNNDMTNLMASTNIASIFLDNNLLIKRITPEAGRFFNILPSDKGRPINHFVSNLKYDHLTADIQDVIDTLAKKEIEVWAKDNRIYLMRILPYRTTENVIDGASITFSDITVLKNALKYKEILIQDIHHRVKNNMTLLISILGLEKSKLSKNKDVADIYLATIDNVIGRINILSQIYTKLYQSENGFESVNSKIFFNDLIYLIKSTFQDVHKIEFSVHIEDILLSFKKVIPLGLIVNELLSNSLKYAFVTSQTGKICISFKRQDSSHLHLQIKDNGQGITGNIEDVKSKSLGLLLVESLTSQIDGEVKITNKQGLCVDIIFKE